MKKMRIARLESLGFFVVIPAAVTVIAYGVSSEDSAEVRRLDGLLLGPDRDGGSRPLTFRVFERRPRIRAQLKGSGGIAPI